MWPVGTALSSLLLGQATPALAPSWGVVLLRWVTRFFLVRGFFLHLSYPPCMGSPFMLPCVPSRDLSLLARRICPACDLPLRALVLHTCTASSAYLPTSASYWRHRHRIHRCYRCERFAVHRCYRCGKFAAQAQHKMDY
jgi:hypothetical protein